MHKVKKAVKDLFINIEDYINYRRRKKSEYKKIQTKERTEIWGKIELTLEQKVEIDNLYYTNYGKKIPYTWHRHYTAYTGNFDKNFLPEYIYTSEFERYMNRDKAYSRVLSNKNMLMLFARGIGIRVPKTIFVVSESLFCDAENNLVSKEEVLKTLSDAGEVFIKPTTGTSSGIGCSILNLQKGKDIISGKTVVEIIDAMDDFFIIQERIKCHDTIKEIYPNSVNTFRIITYRWKNTFYHIPIIMRIGKGGNYLDNAHAGGCLLL